MNKKDEIFERLCETERYSLKGFSVYIREFFPYVYEGKHYLVLLTERVGVTGRKGTKAMEVYSLEENRVLSPEEALGAEIKAQMPTLSDDTTGDFAGGFQEKRELDRESEQLLESVTEKLFRSEEEKARWRAYLRKAEGLHHDAEALYGFFGLRL